MHLLRVGGRKLLQTSVKSTTKPSVVTSGSDILSVLSSVPSLMTDGSSLHFTNNTNASSNTTGGFLMDGEDDDGGYTDMQTVALACVATLIPLFIVLITAFAARVAWRKYREREDSPSSSRGVLRRDESSEPNAAKSAAASTGLLLPEELKTSESAFTVTPVDDPTRLEAPQTPLLGASTGAPTSGPPSSVSTGVPGKSANGSIITLTMQNNHLIVETEALGEGDLDIPLADAISADSLDLECSAPTSQQAQIHDPPAEARSPSPPCLTGLSTSQSSLGSPSYCYGTQSGYPMGSHGYSQSLGYPPKPEPPKKVYTFQARNQIARKRLPFQLSVQEENFAPSHHRTGSLPNRLARTQTISSTPASLIEVDEPKTDPAPRGGGKFKARASLPIINPVTSVLSSLSKDGPASIAE